MRGLFVAMGPAGWVITGLSLLAGALVGVKAGYDQMNTVSLEAAESKQKEIDSINSLTKEFMNNEFSRSKLSYIRINRQTLI